MLEYSLPQLCDAMQFVLTKISLFSKRIGSFMLSFRDISSFLTTIKHNCTLQRQHDWSKHEHF